ncbi:MAG: hypothetical protein ACOY94_03775 [Bacillota bacterium]
MDEEFFFPQNVQTSYRLFMLGPVHLKRLALAPVIALAAVLALYRVTLFGSMALAVLLASVYAAACCFPLMGDDQTLLDVGLEIRRHGRSQGRFKKEVRTEHGTEPEGAA